MGIGLSRNSPVKLTLSRDNYEALIERHGQWCRWRIATRCPCTDKNTMQPDPQCSRCGGLGFTYSYQPRLSITETVMVTDDSGIIEVSQEYENCALDFVYDFNGRKFPNAEKDGCFITLGETPEKSVYITAVMIQDVVKKIDAASCVNGGGGYYRIEGLQSRRNGIDGLYHTASGDVIKVGCIVDAEGKTYTPDELRLDMFHINPLIDEETDEPLPIVEPLVAEEVEYVPPFLFALLSQNLSKEDNEAMVEVHGDAVLTFPYNCDVAEDDILTALSGTYTHKEVVKRNEEGNNDTIGAYFVTDIVSCVGNLRDYEAGIDFLLIGTNYLHWLCDDAPDPGEAYSLTYRICPTYKVLKNIPQIRTSENQRLPKKAIVQLFHTYGEHRGANRQ